MLKELLNLPSYILYNLIQYMFYEEFELLLKCNALWAEWC